MVAAKLEQGKDEIDYCRKPQLLRCYGGGLHELVQRGVERVMMNHRCGNFDIILEAGSHVSFTLRRPAHAVGCALLGARGHRALIGACDPMFCPNWGFRQDLQEIEDLHAERVAKITAVPAPAAEGGTGEGEAEGGEAAADDGDGDGDNADDGDDGDPGAEDAGVDEGGGDDDDAGNDDDDAGGGGDDDDNGGDGDEGGGDEDDGGGGDDDDDDDAD